MSSKIPFSTILDSSQTCKLWYRLHWFYRFDLLVVYKNMNTSVLKHSPALLLAPALATCFNALYPTMELAFKNKKKTTCWSHKLLTTAPKAHGISCGMLLLILTKECFFSFRLDLWSKCFVHFYCQRAKYDKWRFVDMPRWYFSCLLLMFRIKSELSLL